MSAIQATSAQYRIWLDYFCRIGVNVDDITTIPKPLIKGRIAVLFAVRMQQIENAIRFALDLSWFLFDRACTLPRDRHSLWNPRN